MKKCLRCGKLKERTEFKKHKCRKDGLSDWCRECWSEHRKRPEERNRANQSSRKWRRNNPDKVKGQYQRKRSRPWYQNSQKNSFLKALYGLTVEQYNEIFDQQRGECAICGKHQTELTKGLAVDHNHETGKVRGLLCSYCNTAIGSFKESIGTMKKAIEYIKTDKGE